MPTSEEELQKKQERVAKLREQVATEEQKRVQRERELANDVTAAQLEAEAVRLESRLDAAKDANKVSAVKSGAAAPLEAAKEEVKQAEAVQKAQANTRKSESEDRRDNGSKSATTQPDDDTKKES